MGYRRNRSYRGGGPNFLGLIILLCFSIITWFTNASKTTKYLVILAGLVFISLMMYLFIRKQRNNRATSNMNKEDERLVTANTPRTVDNYEERSLLTETESKFYRYLSDALVDYDVVINTKTRLEDIAKVKANTRSEYMRARGYVKSRHIDFILCDKSMNVICGIEVDDDSHLDPKAKEIDKFKDDLFNKINKTLFRVKNLNKLEETAEYIVETLYKDKK